MNCVRTRVLCMGVVALLLLSLAGTGVTAVQEEQKGEARDGVAEEILPEEAKEAPVIAVYGWQGFALKADGEVFHMLRIHIVGVRQIDPTVIRELLGEDMSIEDIRGEIRGIEKEQPPFYRGFMRFVQVPYMLANISVTPEGDNFTINADVMHTLQGLEQSESAGNISLTVMDYEGVMISKGKLIMHGEEYQVLLGVLPQSKK